MKPVSYYIGNKAESKCRTVFVNDPLLLDGSILGMDIDDEEPNNVRVYAPIDLNPSAILRRLGYLLYSFGEICEENEDTFTVEVMKLISQMEIYDEYWRKERKLETHCPETIRLARRMIEELDSFQYSKTELFPNEEIEYLSKEYGIEYQF